MDLLQNRVRRVQEKMGQEQVDLLLLGPTSNLFYLTGLTTVADERLQLGVVSAQGGVHLLLPEMYRNIAEGPQAFWELSTWQDGENLSGKLQGLLGRPPKVAIDETMRAEHLMLLLPHLQGAQLVPASQVIQECRIYKDALEVQAIREACALVDQVVLDVIPLMREGMTEVQLAWQLERLCREHGAQGPSFHPIVGFGPGGADPHHDAGDIPLERNQMVVMDFGAKWNHYCSDITRTVCFGSATEEMRKVYNLVLQANRAAFQAAKVGVPCEAVDAAARKVITDGGYGPYFVHRTGHGLGLDIHEEAYIVQGSTRPLAKGMVFSVEPGIYLPGRFGVRIEDLAAMGDHQAECLNNCPRELVETDRL